MADLREVVARVVYDTRRCHGNAGLKIQWDDLTTGGLYSEMMMCRDGADAVLAAIRKDHAIVERVGKDVAEAAARARLRAFTGQDIWLSVSAGERKLMVQAMEAAAPIIAAHAGDAALEEAAGAIRALFAEIGDGIPFYNQALADAEEDVRALKSGGQTHG